MIKFLRIQNFATIEDLEVHFEKGFSILTGETGAGKSIIIDGIKLLLGEKASSDTVRTGKEEASLEAIFQFVGAKETGDKDSGLENEIFIQRTISHQGTGKAYVNGILSPVKKLREACSGLVDIYGQNDHIFLLHLENHLDYLDRAIGSAGIREEVSFQAQELKRLIRKKNELERKKREREQRMDFLDFQLKEIEKSQLKPGEWEDIIQERHLLKNAEKIALLLEKALDISYTQENSLSSLLAKLQNVVSELSRFDGTFQTMNESFSQFAITLQEFSDYLIKFKENQTLAPEKLEVLEERLDRIEKLKRKYGETVEDILSYYEKIRQEHTDLSDSQDMLVQLETELEKKFNLYHTSAEKLSRIRREGARKLEKSIEEEIIQLGMKKARFHIKIEAQPLTNENMETAKETGLDNVEFLMSPNPGEELRPLRKIASGGELSRVMLALKSIGKEKETMKTFIFDEIDSGIGGKTADIIAQKLRSLSEQNQVICITHLPQIASFAPWHYRIDKKIERNRTYTTVKKLNFDERVTEISQLLSGSRVTSTALENAREMLLHNLKNAGSSGGKVPEEGKIS